MTAQTQTPAAAGRGFGPTLVIAGVAALLLFGVFAFGQAARTVSLDRSAIGFEGLPRWLAANDIGSRTFYGRSVLEPRDVDLRIVPLFDVDLNADKDDTNDDEAVMAETERDMRSFVLRAKTRNLPTLVVMPKWRAGVREAEAVHPTLLISDESADRLTRQIGAGVGKLVRDATTPTATGTTLWGGDYMLHYPQTLRDSGCEPVIGTKDAMLLAECDYEKRRRFWVLADPDLLNNHGLTQGDNAAIALDWLTALATPPDTATGEDAERGEIVVDLTSSVWAYQRRQQPRRSWSELGRFFEYPFSIIWWSFACLGALVFWRAWRRYGAADARSEEESGPRASRMLAMDTKARLLRLAGRDDALVRTYVEDRLDALADAVLGPHRTRGPDDRARMVAAIERRAPALAAEFAPYRAADALAASPDTLLRHAAHLDDLIERTLDELGRTGRAR